MKTASHYIKLPLAPQYMQKFNIILTLLLIGMGIKRLPAFPKETGNALNLIGIYIIRRNSFG